MLAGYILFIVIVIGLPIIGIKKFVLKKQIRIVPKSNIIKTSEKQSEEFIEMKTFHAKSRIIQVQAINIIDVNEIESQSSTRNLVNDPNIKLPQSPPNILYNNSKRNKNLINFTGMILISVMFIIIGYFPLASRLGWISQRNGNTYLFVPICCIPVILPTIYFMSNPKHLIKVLRDMQFL